MRTFLFFTISILISVTSFSQNDRLSQDTLPDIINEGSPHLSPLEQSIKEQGGGVFRKENNKDRVMRGINKETKKYETTYPHVREADVMWSTTIWREIDLRHKMNQPLYFPARSTPNPNMGGYRGYDDESFLLSDRRSLIDVIFSSVIHGDPSRDLPPLPCYDNTPDEIEVLFDDEFKEQMTQAEIKKEALGPVTVKTKYDTTIDADVSENIYNDYLQRTDVTKYWIKEEWFFDKQRSVMDVRIVGIAPVKEKLNEDGLWEGYQPIFWLYFPEARPYLAGWEVFNHQNNNASRMTYDDLFMMRYFNSTIFKESNPHDRSISDYKVGLDALLESEKIKNKIFNLELDLWEY